MAWVSYHIQSVQWDAITHLFHNFNGGLAWEWMSNEGISTLCVDVFF